MQPQPTDSHPADPTESGLETSSQRLPSRWSVLTPYLVTCILFVVFYLPRFQPNSCLLLSDYLDQNIPNRVYATLALRSGSLPEWSDALFGGYPFLSDPQSAVFYPPHLLLAALVRDVGRSSVMDVVVLGHFLLLALGAVFLARSVGIGPWGSVAASIVITYNGYMICHLSHTVIMEPIAAGLWGFGLMVRSLRTRSMRKAVAAGLLFASCILTGHWQTALFLFYMVALGGIAVAVMLCARDGGRRAFVLMLGLLLAACLIGFFGALGQTLPTWHYLGMSIREKLLYREATVYSYPLAQLPGLAMPSLYQPLFWNLEAYPRWSVSHLNWGVEGSFEYLFHVGIVALGLGLLGFLCNVRRAGAWLLAGGFVFSVLVALGSNGPVYGLLFRYAPGFKQIRIPPRQMWVGFVALGMLAGMGVDAIRGSGILKQIRSQALRSVTIVIAFVLLGLSALVGARATLSSWGSVFEHLFVRNPAFQIGTHRAHDSFMIDIATQLILGGVFTAAVLLLYLGASTRRFPRAVLCSVSILALFAELWVYGYHKNIGPGAHRIDSAVSSMHAALPAPPEGRMLSAQPETWGKNSGLVTGSPYAGGYNPIVMKASWCMRPDETFPSGSAAMEKFLDLWNVTDFVYSNRLLEGVLPGRNVRVPLTGFIFLQPESEFFRDELTWEIADPRPIRSVHVIASGGYDHQPPKRTPIGVLSVDTADGISTFPLVPGANVKRVRNIHNEVQTLPSFRDRSDSVPLYFNSRLVSFDLPETATVRRLSIKVRGGRDGFLGVSHVVLDDGSRTRVLTGLEAYGYRTVPSQKREWIVNRRHSRFGYAWMVPEARSVDYGPDLRRVSERIGHPSFDPAKRVLILDRHLATSAALALSAPEPAAYQGSAVYNRIRPGLVEVQTDANQRGWLVLSQTWHPGWSVEIDGRPGEIVSANGAHAAVAVPEGKHDLRLRFGTPHFRWTAPISVAVWLASLVYLLCWRRSKPL